MVADIIDKYIISTYIQGRLDTEHKRICTMNSEYSELLNKVEKTYEEILRILELNKSLRVIEFEILKNKLTSIEIEAAYKLGFIDGHKLYTE